MAKVVGEDNVVEFPISISSEDFSRFGDIVPAVFFRTGIKNLDKGISGGVAHHSSFELSESALIYGVKTAVQFVLDNQSGIDIEKARKSDTRENGISL
jgi:metal-dependent amidase/aminoacylase/carboxypeptidase family protein